MGCSSSATLFWGLCGQEEGDWYNLNREYGDPDYIESEEHGEDEGLRDWEAAYVKQMGLVETDKDLNQYWNKHRELVIQSGCTISSYGVYDYVVPIVAIQDSIVESWHRPREVNIRHLHLSQLWTKQLKAFCEVMNIKWSDPKWWLVSSYG